MRLLVGMCAVLITLGAAFDLLIVIDLINRDSLRLSVGTYLNQGPEFVRWVREVLGMALSEAVVSPVFALPAGWFFGLRATVFTLLATLIFASLKLRSV